MRRKATRVLTTLSSKQSHVLKTALVCLSLFISSLSFAQSGISDDVKSRALQLAQTIQSENIVVDPKLSYVNVKLYEKPLEEQLRIHRQIAMDTISMRNHLDANKTLAQYEKMAIQHNSAVDIAIVDVFKLYTQLIKVDEHTVASQGLLKKLTSYQQHENWFIANRAYIMVAAFNGKNLHLTTALSKAQEALQLIPIEQSARAKEAKYDNNDIIAYLYVLLNNPEFALEATEQTVLQGRALGRSIDGVAHIGNLAYLFEKWREYETAATLSEILIKLAKRDSSKINTIAHLRYGQSLNNIERYKDAIPYLASAIKLETNTRLLMSLNAQLAVSYAGMGKEAQALSSLEEVAALSLKSGVSAKGLSRRKTQAKALIALNRNDARTTYSLINALRHQEIQATFKKIGATAQSQLAELQNSTERQQERESALRLQADLKQKEVDAKQRSLVLLMALTAALLFLTIGAFSIAAWRQRTNKVLAISAIKAESGDRAKSQFLSVMSHELRTPLNGIIGISSLLSEYGETQQLRDQNKIILDSGNNLLQLLNGIIDMSQMESGTLDIVTAPANIHQLVDDLFQTFRPQVGEQVQFTCHIASTIPQDLMLDGIHVKQALSNLISNAVKFTDKGRIHIHVTMDAPTSKNKISDLTLIIADTGQGIAEHAKPQLFKPFVQADSSITRDHGGAGVGLAVTRGLARLMGGDVTMNSSSGRGSEFTMTVKTCQVQDASFDTETNRPVFIVEPSENQAVDFAPAVSLEELKAQEAIRAEKRPKPSAVPAPQPKSIGKAELFGQPDNVELEQLLPESLMPDDIDPEDLEVMTLTDADIQGQSETVDEFDTISAQETPVINSGADLASHILETQEVLVPLSPNNGMQTTQLATDAVQTRVPANNTMPAHDQLEGLNILIVEDTLANQIVIQSLLQPVGCNVAIAEHGRKAIEMLATQPFDVVLMDIRMPVMNGIEATLHIRTTPTAYQNIPIIALTADVSAETNAQCLAAGADVFLTKPVVISELFSSIRFVREKAMRQQQDVISA